VRATRITILNNMVTPYTNRLYERLWQEGVSVSVVSCTSKEANRSWGENDRALYPHAVLPGRVLKLGPGRYAHVNSGAGAALSATRPDFLFINGFYPTMLSGAWWALRNGVPMGLITEGWRETMPNSLAHRIVRPLVLSRCRAVVTNGKKGAAYFTHAGIAPDRLFEIPLVSAWDAPARLPGFAERPFHLLWCAHLNDAQKNISFFLDVVERLKGHVPQLRVRLVGSGEMAGEAVARLCAAGVTYQHEPSVDWRCMADVYASARVLMLPSRWEPWGLVCDEALQCGVPCIVSRHVGAGDDLVISGSNGYVLPLDTEIWIERCLPLMTEEGTWTAFSERARASVAARGIRHSTERFIEMMRRL
jgi:glycosyltransferase involved in cell wall biosynthesis